MKSLILGLAIVCLPLVSARAETPKTFETTLSCAVVTWQGMHANKLFWQNVTLKEGEEVEIYKTETASYVVYLDQHETEIAPKTSSLFLYIRSLDGKVTFADSSAFWPRLPADGRLEGFERLDVRTDKAEPNVDVTTFMCDNRLVEK